LVLGIRDIDTPPPPSPKQGSQLSEITERWQNLTTSFTLKIFTDEKQREQTNENENKTKIVTRFWCCVILFCLQ
jgi:hypothetical protein